MKALFTNLIFMIILCVSLNAQEFEVRKYNIIGSSKYVADIHYNIDTDSVLLANSKLRPGYYKIRYATFDHVDERWYYYDIGVLHINFNKKINDINYIFMYYNQSFTIKHIATTYIPDVYIDSTIHGKDSSYGTYNSFFTLNKISKRTFNNLIK